MMSLIFFFQILLKVIYLIINVYCFIIIFLFLKLFY